MESIGAEKMFNTTTVVKRNLYHTSFYGDSDSKTFTVVENVYGPEKKVSKLYFGIALRQNTRNLEKMVSACKVSMFHVAGYHENCPKDENTWCQFQKDKLEGTRLYKDKGGLHFDVRAAILPVYNDLCKEENLAKCLHSRTKNASFNT